MIFSLKTLIFLKRLTAAFFINLILKPGRVLARFIFYKILVKLYKFYIWFVNKLGWKQAGKNFLSKFINPKSAHIAVILLAVIFIFINFTEKISADSSVDEAGNTILSQLIKSEFGDEETGELIEETFDEEAIISPAQQSYLENLTAVKPEPGINMAPSEEEIERGGIITQEGALVKPNIVTTKKIKKLRKEIIYYAIKEGDTISTVAADFDVSVNTILWENDLSAYSIIRPGDKIAILPVSGVTHKVGNGESLASIVKKYNIEESEILAINNLSDAGKLAAGQKLIIPGGSKTAYAISRPKRYSGLNVIRDLVEIDGAKPVAGNKMNWPTLGHRLTQYFSWRHYALDIANKVGTPIYAADAGVIEYAGWGKGYGNQIVIDHGGGKKTRYAHLSKFYIKKGDRVGKGEAIGAMGSTGRSTGPHLHFEIIINGKKYNPLNYVK